MMEGWKRKKILEFAKTTSGGTPSRKIKAFYHGNNLWVKSGELNDNFIYNTEEKITDEAIAKSSAKLFPKGTILMAMYGATVGKTAILKNTATTNQAICGIFPNSKIFDNHFIRFQLIYKREEFLKQRYGGAQPNISQTIIKNFEIDLPPLQEQNKIAYALSTIQKAIEQQDKLIRTTTELKKAMMQKLFTEGLYGEKQKDTEIGLVPESWEVVKLSNIVLKSKGGGTPSTKKSNYWNGDIFWTTSKWLNKEKIFLYDGEKKITLEGLENSSSNLLPINNLLVSTRVVIGKVAINKIPIAYSQDLTGLWIDKSRYDLKFLAYQFQSKRVKEYLQSLKRGATIQGITREDLLNTLFVVPSLYEQQQIGKAINDFDSKIELHQKKKQTLIDLFKTLLHELMTGQRRVNEIDFENNKEELLMAAEPEIKYND